MSERTHLLVQQWLQQANISADTLHQLANDHPYFSAAHLLLFQMQDSNSPAYAELKHKAALHVYNPMLLEEKGQTLDFPFEEKATIDNYAPAPHSEVTVVTPYEPVSIEEKEIEAFDNMTTEENATEEIPLLETAELDAPAEEDYDTNEVETENDADDAPLNITMPADLDPAGALPVQHQITFEPFHTVDYFASQGIRLSQNEAGNDRMGKQLKSFTEWLKTMKKLPDTALTQNTDAPGERKVANLAEHSLQKADIITEAMAEVWVKQGNREKASEVYNKLSLQNPSKRAYFAAKIESLKKPS